MQLPSNPHIRRNEHMSMELHDPRFDDVARGVAGATSRRQALRVLGAGLGGGVLALVGSAPAMAVRRCRRVGEKCRASVDCCVGTCCGGGGCADGPGCPNGGCVTPPPPPPGGGAHREICVCGGGTHIQDPVALHRARRPQKEPL